MIVQNPEHIRSYTVIGDIYSITKCHDRAIEYYGKAATLDKNDLVANSRIVGELTNPGRLSLKNMHSVYMPYINISGTQESPTIKILIYANCQGAISQLLAQHFYGHASLSIRHIINYLPDQEIDLPDFINDADIFIYQPKKYSNNGQVTFGMDPNIKDALPRKCLAVSFPYVYNNSFWPIVYGDNNTVITSHGVSSMVTSSRSQNYIAECYDNGELDFDFTRRFVASIENLINRERFTDVNISDVIINNQSGDCLFIDQAHPKTSTLLEVVKRIISIVHSRPSLREYINEDAIISDDDIDLLWGHFLPIDIYSSRHFGFTAPDTRVAGYAANYYKSVLAMAANGHWPIRPWT